MHTLKSSLLIVPFMLSASAAWDDVPFIATRDSSRSQLGIYENPALADEASAVWINPAGLAVPRSSSFFASRSFDADITYTNILSGSGNGGFGWQRTNLGGGKRVDRWRGVFAGGDRGHGIATGVAVQLADPDGSNEGLFWSADVGVLARPMSWISAGVVARQLGAPSSYPWSVETGLALRPAGPMFSFAGGLVWSKDDKVGDPSGWHIGALANLGPGVEAGVSMNQDRSLQAGLRLVLGNGSIGGSRWRYRDDGGYGPAWGVIQFHQDYRNTIFHRRGNIAEIRLRGVIRDQGSFSLFGGGTVSLHSIITQIKRAESAPDVGGLYVRIEGLSIGQGMADELRVALVQFKERSKKPIVAYLASADVREYYIASVADSIYLEPLGHLDFIGYAAEAMFLRRGLKKLGVEPELVRVGEYKSATEMFTDSTLSQPYREQLVNLLDDWFGQLVDAVAQARGVTTDSVRTLIDDGPYTASGAKVHGLVDALGHEDEAFESAKALVKLRARRVGARVNLASRRPYDERWGPRPQIAVVFASGDIVTGDGGTDIFMGSQFIGAETMVKALKKVREDNDIKAVVLRVDSPGGFALASDMIWREADRLRKADKPFIVSVGDLAASGGYYIACAGDSIVSNPGAIVGSIGIFGGKLTMSGLFHKLGIDFETVKRGENADIYSSQTPFTAEQRAKAQADVEEGYDIFLTRVADGRGMTKAEVDSVARGRIFSGERGIDRGIVDRTGGLADAVQMAMRMAGIKYEAEIVSYPRRPSFWEAIREGNPAALWRWNWAGDRLFYDPTAAMLR